MTHHLKSYSFKKIDAFARGLSGGNPAGAVYLAPDEAITPREMQKIAYELKGFVSEVGFVRLPEPGLVELRYFSALREVDFCGHATIAILYDLLLSNPALAAEPRLRLRTQQDQLEAQNRLAEEDAVYIRAPEPVVLDLPLEAAPLAKALRLQVGDLHPSFPLAALQVGLRCLLVPMAGLKALRGLHPDLDELNAYCKAIGVDIAVVFTPETHLPQCRWRSRVFAATFGYLEDPATGSGNAALGHYLLRQGAWQGEPLTLEQGTSLEHPNQIQLRTELGPQGQPQVWFGGGAVTRISGRYFLARE